MAAPQTSKTVGTECHVFGCSRRSRKPWTLYICGKHWPMANREHKRELRRLDREFRKLTYEPTTLHPLWVGIHAEYDKIAEVIFSLETGTV